MDYCCAEGSAGNCCDDGVGRFPVLPPNPQVWATRLISSGFAVVKHLATASAKSSTASSSPTLSSSSTSSPSPTPTSSAPAERQDQTPGLSSAAKASIGVGVAVGALLIATVAYLVWKLNRQKKMMEGGQTPTEASQLMGGNYDSKGPMGAALMDQKVVSGPIELPAQSVVGELSALSPAVQRLSLIHI